MKKMLINILIVVVIAVAALAAFIASRPSDFTITRTATMSAPPSTVFAQVDDFHKWTAWSPWENIDPALKREYSGPDGGTGAHYHWAGNRSVGEGQMTIAESKPGELIRIKLEFLRPFKATNDTAFSFAPQGNGTLVTWTMKGKNNFMMKAMGLMMNMDKVLGGQFEQGLAAMKTASEGAGKT